MESYDKIQRYLHLKKVTHNQHPQKFFQRLPTSISQELNKQILINHQINVEIIALNGIGFINDYAYKYYAIIRRKERKNYVKNHISIDVDSRSIFHFAAQRGPRFNTHFAIAAIRNIKKYNPKYILADRACDTEPTRKCINKESKAEKPNILKNQIKNKTLSIKKQKYIQTRNNMLKKKQC